MNNELPLFLKPYFWSYKFEQLSLEKNPRTIIQSLLRYGDQQATTWLFSVYPKNVIRDVFASTYCGEYDGKSLNMWEIVFGLTLKNRSDVITKHANI